MDFSIQNYIESYRLRYVSTALIKLFRKCNLTLIDINYPWYIRISLQIIARDSCDI